MKSGTNLLVAAALLAACDSSAPPEGANQSAAADNAEAAFRREFRASFQRECVKSARASSGADLDFAPVCGCAADRLLAEQGIAKLIQPPTREMIEPAMLACLRENPLR